MARRGRPPIIPGEDGAPPKRLSPDEELALALEVARAYYLEDASKLAIAERFNITRFQVARLIALARKSGMVHIEVRAPGGVDRELSALLQAALDVREAVVVSSIAGLSPLEDIGHTLANTVTRLVRPDDVVGLTWSRATVSMSSQLTHLEPCSIVQLGGHVQAPELPGSVEIIRKIAQLSGGVAYPIYAPLIVEDGHTAESLKREPPIAAAFEQFEKLTLAVLSVGAWMPSGSTVYDDTDDELRLRATQEGVVGEIGGRLYDKNGEPVPHLLDDRVIGIELEQLRRIPRLIVSSYGAYRAEATIALARAGLIKTLVADRSVALAILERFADESQQP